MAFHPGDVDPDTADRLLAGRMVPDDAPPGYREVARLLHQAHMENGPHDGADDRVVAAMVDAIVAGRRARTGRRRRAARFTGTKVAAVTAVFALSATGAAAATGNLPEPAQGRIARAAQHIGINLPSTTDDTARNGTPEGGPGPRAPS